MSQEAEEQGLLLLLPERTEAADMCPVRKDQMYAEDGGLCHPASRSVHHGTGDGGM